MNYANVRREDLVRKIAEIGHMEYGACLRELLERDIKAAHENIEAVPFNDHQTMVFLRGTIQSMRNIKNILSLNPNDSAPVK